MSSNLNPLELAPRDRATIQKHTEAGTRPLAHMQQRAALSDHSGKNASNPVRLHVPMWEDTRGALSQRRREGGTKEELCKGAQERCNIWDADK